MTSTRPNASSLFRTESRFRAREEIKPVVHRTRAPPSKWQKQPVQFGRVTLMRWRPVPGSEHLVLESVRAVVAQQPVLRVTRSSGVGDLSGDHTPQHSGPQGEPAAQTPADENVTGTTSSAQTPQPAETVDVAGGEQPQTSEPTQPSAEMETAVKPEPEAEAEPVADTAEETVAEQAAEDNSTEPEAAQPETANEPAAVSAEAPAEAAAIQDALAVEETIATVASAAEEEVVGAAEDTTMDTSENTAAEEPEVAPQAD
eukprot:m.284061 g.284061  ORF g.284061 m.284061 type:complete len:258 (+) comp54962_c0_seq1:117-890(+)